MVWLELCAVALNVLESAIRGMTASMYCIIFIIHVCSFSKICPWLTKTLRIVELVISIFMKVGVI